MNIAAHGIGPGSPNPIIAVARTIGARYLISVNSLELCQAAQNNGMQSIHREKSARFDDDDQDNHTPNEVVVQTMHNDLAAWGINPRWISNGNELTNSQPQRTSDWLIAGAKKAYALGDTLVQANWYMQGPGDAYFKDPDVKRALKVMADTGMVMGFHRGATPTLDTFDKSLAGGGIGGFEQIQKDYPGLRIAITEFGATKDNKGYLTWYADRYSKLVKQAYEYYGEHGVLFMAHFTVMPWSVSPGFELDGNTALQQDMYAYNQEVIVVQPTYPDGTTPAPKLITVPAGLKLRAAPSLTGALIRVMRTHEAVTVYADPVVLADSYNWQRVIDAQGHAGWAANFVDGAASWSDPLAVDTPHFRVEVPFYSQLGADANLRNDDCLPASCRMLLAFDCLRHGMGDPALFTVNDLTLKTPLAAGDHPLSISDGLTLLAGLGVKAAYKRPLDRAAIALELQAGRPVIILCNYRYLNPAQTTDLGHFCIVKAVGERGFWLADPYLLGDDAYVTNEALAAAMSDVNTFASFPNQGIVLVA